MRLVVLGLSLSSSWGNGHATTWRALLRAFAARGHDVLFLERDVPWYAAHRDLTEPEYCELAFYRDLDELERFRAVIAGADAVLVGSYVPEGVAIARFVLRHAHGTRAFYDIDTPVTLGKLARGEADYMTPELVSGFDLYLSFTGGASLDVLRHTYGARRAAVLYCSVDVGAYAPAPTAPRWDLSYLGTYSLDRQPTLQRLLIDAAIAAPEQRFIVAGPQYPADIPWPANIQRAEHVPPDEHAAFYNASRWTLNVTRAEMVRAGHSPSVRLFEAAACATPVISDPWLGLAELFVPDREIVLARDAADVLGVLRGWTEPRRAALAAAARRRVLREHTAERRAAQLEAALLAARAERPISRGAFLPTPTAQDPSAATSREPITT